MAENSYTSVEEGLDVGSGLNDALGCAVASLFYVGSGLVFLSSIFLFFT